MARRGPRQIIFVCGAVVNGKLVMEMVERSASEEAQNHFSQKHGSRPEAVLGPFYRKRMGILNNQASVSFTGKSQVAVYDDWYVTAMELKAPHENAAWVFFINRVDGKKMPKPQSLVVETKDISYLTPAQLQAYKQTNSSAATPGTGTK